MPGTVALQGHELVVHVFFAIERPGDHRVALDLWRRAVAEFALTDPLAGHPHGFPTAAPEVADGEVLLAARAARAPGVHQMAVRQVHDVLCLSLVCAPRAPVPWADLDVRWRRVRPRASPSVLGSVRILQARVAGPGSALDAVDPAAWEPPGARSRWIGGVVEPETRIGPLAVWEALDDGADQATLDGRDERDLVVVAPADRDPQLSAFTWSRGGPWLTPFGHYLLHTAKLRRAVRTRSTVVRAEPRLRAAVERAGARLAPFVGRAAGKPDGAAALVAELTAAEFELGKRQSLLVELRSSVAAAETNMGLYAGRDRSVGLFAEDGGLAPWLVRQIGDDLDHFARPAADARRLLAAVTPLPPDSPEPSAGFASARPQGILRDALLAAYPRYEQLAALLDGLGRPHAGYAPRDPMDEVVASLVTAAEAEGWTAQLATQCLLRNPGNLELKALVEGGLLDLDTVVAAVAHGADEAVARIRPPATVFADPDGANLEHVIREFDGMQNPMVFGAELALSVRRVCLIDTPDLATEGGGTGFLVAPDLVLTNHHVIAAAIGDAAKAANVRCVFDHHVGPDGVIDDGIPMRLATSWLVAASPSSPVDGQARPAGLPRGDELDYALVRLVEPVPEPAFGSRQRGWFDLLADPPAVRSGQTMLVLQHPERWLLKMAVGPVLAVNDNRTRLTHHVNTANGSSGGPLLSLEMRLAALHQAGSPRDAGDPGAAKINVAVPIATIRQHLLDRGYGRLFRRPDRG